MRTITFTSEWCKYVTKYVRSNGYDNSYVKRRFLVHRNSELISNDSCLTFHQIQQWKLFKIYQRIAILNKVKWHRKTCESIAKWFTKKMDSRKWFAYLSFESRKKKLNFHEHYFNPFNLMFFLSTAVSSSIL